MFAALFLQQRMHSGTDTAGNLPACAPVDLVTKVRLSRMLLDPSLAETVVDPRDAAESAGLVYVSDEEPGIRRRKAGKGFTYLRQGQVVKDAATLQRIKSLAI